MDDQPRKIRVLQTGITDLHEGGINVYILENYARLDKERFQLDFTTSEPDAATKFAPLIAQGSRVFTVPRIRQRKERCAAYRKLFAEHPYDIVHIPESYLAELDLIRLAKASGAKVIVHSHSTRMDQQGPIGWLGNLLHRFNRRRLAPYTDVRAACSTVAADWMFGKAARGHVLLLHNAVQTDRFRFDAAVRQEMRRQLGLADSTFAVGHIGRFSYAKNHEFLLGVFEEIHRRQPDSVLLLVGVGEHEQKIRRLAAASGCGDAIRFLGARDDVHRLLQAMDVFLLPSRFEGLPLVGIEAQAADLPCLFSDGVTREAAVLDGAVTFLPLAESPAVWAQTALDTRSHRRADRTQEMIDAGYDLEHEVQVIAALYESLATGRR